MWIYGRNAILEAVSSVFFIHEIQIQQDINISEKLERIIDKAKSKNTKISYTGRDSLSRIVKNEEHQGIIANIEFKTQKLKDVLKNANSSFIYITESSYTHNIGAITRSAEGAGFSGVIIHPKQDITPDIIKTSAGAFFHIPIIKDSVFNTIKMMKDNGYFIYGIERGGVRYFDQDLTQNALFIIGGEDKSLTDTIANKCDAILEIPQFGTVNSLNMSVAASVVFYEHIRQKLVQ